MRNIDSRHLEEEDAVEKLFCIPFEANRQVVPLKDEHSQFLMFLLLGDKEKKEEAYEKLKSKIWAFEIFSKRIGSLGYTVEKDLELYLVPFLNSPGKMVQYVYFTAYKAKQDKIEHITLDTFINWLPDGLFSESYLSGIWDGQKVKTKNMGAPDNLLDYPNCSKSLRVKSWKK